MCKKYRIGIDAGGTKVAYGLFDADGQLLDRMQHPSDINADGPAFSDRMIETIREIEKKHNLKNEDLQGIGICMPSYILFDTGYVYLTSALTNIRDFPMKKYLQERLPGVKIVLDNDSNAAALAEYRKGAGRGSRHMIYMATSTGIGSGIIIDGKLFRGSYGWAGECGHMLATPDEGIMCGCRNRGCFMSHASGRYVPKHLKIKMLEGRETSMVDKEDLSCEDLLAAYNEGDELAIEMVEQMAHYIAVCAYNCFMMLNINVFVFGGGLTHFGDALFGRVRKEFDRYNQIPLPVEFRFAELKKDFGIVGASELVLD